MGQYDSAGRGAMQGLFRGYGLLQRDRALDLQEKSDRAYQSLGMLRNQILLGQLQQRIKEHALDAHFKKTDQYISMMTDNETPYPMQQMALKKYFGTLDEDDQKALGINISEMASALDPKAFANKMKEIKKVRIKLYNEEYTPEQAAELEGQILKTAYSEARRQALETGANSVFDEFFNKETPEQKERRELRTYEGKKKIDERYPDDDGISLETPEISLQIGRGKTTKKIFGKELESFRATKLASQDLIDISESILNDVKNDPTLIGASGWAQRKINSVGRQLEGIANKISSATGKNVNLDVDKYDWKSLSSDATKSADIKSRVIKMAYAVARIREPDARQFSDADIQRAIDEIGGATGSPEQMASVMKVIQLDAVKGLQRQHMALYKKPFRPEGLTEDTVNFYKSKGVPEEEIILEHIKKYGAD
jgi:hypothetical protein